jgi:hypothetical protein
MKFTLTASERVLFQTLRTPEQVRAFLDTLPFNHEPEGPTFRSPREVLKAGEAHCIEGACLAAALLWSRGYPPLLLDLRTLHNDEDHVVTLYQRNGYWGALSKTNHAILRHRDPIYRTVRELALSYFHEFYLWENGRKTLATYSAPFDLQRFGTEWVTSEKDLLPIAEALDDSRHFSLVPKKNASFLHPASVFERAVISPAHEWPKKKKKKRE